MKHWQGCDENYVPFVHDYCQTCGARDRTPVQSVQCDSVFHRRHGNRYGTFSLSVQCRREAGHVGCHSIGNFDWQDERVSV